LDLERLCAALPEINAALFAAQKTANILCSKMRFIEKDREELSGVVNELIVVFKKFMLKE